MRRLPQHPLGPLIQTLTSVRGRLERRGMHRGIQTQHQGPRCRFFWRLPNLRAGRRVVIDSFMEGGLKCFNALPMKTDDVIDVQRASARREWGR